MIAGTSAVTLKRANDVNNLNVLCTVKKLRTVPKECCDESFGESIRSELNEDRGEGGIGKEVVDELSEAQPGTIKVGFSCRKLVRKKNLLVCAEGFPMACLGVSWLEEGYELYLYSDAMTDAIRSVLPSHVTEVDFDNAVARIEVTTTITVITGSLRFAQSLVNASNTFPLLNSLLVIPYNRFRKGELRKTGLQWSKVTHASLGGVTTSAWSVGTPRRLAMTKLAELSPSFGIQRAFKHVIKDGEPGKVVAAPSSVKLPQLISLKAMSLDTYTLPCYRACTGWVTREISSFELGMAFDFNELVLKQLISSFDKDSALRSLIMISVPGKLSQLAHAAITQLWKGKTILDSRIAESTVHGGSSSNEILGSGVDRGNLLLLEPSLDVERKFKEEDSDFLEREAAYLVDYGQKAVKSDDAQVPIELWDRGVLRYHFGWLSYDTRVAAALSVIRSKFGLKIYITNLRRSFLSYIKSVYGINWYLKARHTSKEASDLRLDLKVGLDSIVRGIHSSWWDWSEGSTCHFWRWPREIRKAIRDGFPVFVEKKLPEYKAKQMFRGLTEDQMAALSKKINKVIARGYLNEGYVKSLINYFAVPKGLTDIRVVYDGTKSGLTDAVWAPNFFMPSVDSLLLYCSADTWWSDLDLGEMFLNYFMDPILRPYCGVDVSKFVETRNNSVRKWLQWNRIFMGFRSSPYYAVKAYSWCLDMVKGNPDDSSNPFAFNNVKLNLPGSKEYDPVKPWLVKMFGSNVANEIVVYMDDGRPHGNSERGCRRAGKRTSKVTQYLGQQDAARKYRPPSQQPGPWCGAFVAERNGSLWAYVSDEKWMKAKKFISGWLDEIEWCRLHSTPAALDFKNLEKGRGFLVYLSRTYPSIVPYLKGVHLTLDSWRPNRDTDGWKTKPSDGIDLVDEVDDEEVLAALDKDGELKPDASNLYSNHPNKVSLAPRFYADVAALNLFFKATKPSWRFVRGKEICVVEYGFGDASGAGFGASFEMRGGIKYRLGVWGRDVGGESSNFRELSNLVDALVDRADDVHESVKGLEVFLFTDNIVAEGAFYKGTSSSKKLFDLILKLRLLEMDAGMRIHIIHIAGSRMICQGTDGLSRGDVNEGVMQGMSMLNFVPLSQSCLERSESLKSKLEWCLKLYINSVKQELQFLSVKDWFLRGHDICGGQYNSEGMWIPKYKSGTYVWVPPPAAGQHAIEQLRQARLKRTTSTHLFLIPRIFTSLWRKQLHKVADLVVDLPFDDCCWKKLIHHEPLTFACIFPFIPIKPWQLKRTYAFLGMGRVLRRLWKESHLSTWDILHKFLSWAGRLSTMPESMVRKMLQSPSSFEVLCGKTRE